MLSPARMIAAKVTPAPGVGEQVETDLKAATEGAKSILDKFPEFFSHLLISAIVLVIGLVIIKLGKKIIAGLARRRSKNSKVNSQRSETFRSIITSIFSYIMFFILVTIILNIFGVDVTSLLAAAGVVGIALAFGAQTLVKDLLAGLFIWGEGTIAVGDLVSINDLDGTVESITIRTTSIRNYNGNIYNIPNGDIRTITNMSRGFKRAIVNVPCPYEESQERLVSMVKEEMEIAAKEVEGIRTVPDVMSIVAFDKNSVRLQVAVVCPVGEHWRIEREIRTRIKARFDREGIMMPHYSVPETET
ncbi:mechanosensitive ion channel family protein [Aristaeella lactis]|uniref:Small conductance mechanosensitive channel n=1 Tax=Aristaeella lactis TaxID=3046383 RepID=A0AC61PPN7_9FIRM|nr:mechanosensitive ion channel family protein [Aristaeella lactis]QUA54345.1 mechanosensitive ion channel family protein [Aristaeella lactis]SMC84074.1 small conductance mechanosensitive channel [Aristaeella lactis]